jgi:Phage baseplate assembly protein W
MRAAPKLPLEFGDGGMESYTDDEIKEIIKQNFKMVIMTNPGERIMIPDFGVGIRRYLFELRDSENIETLLSEIEEQARTYIPPINVLDIEVADEDPNNPNLLGLTISYEIDFLNARDRLDLLVEY